MASSSGAPGLPSSEQMSDLVQRLQAQAAAQLKKFERPPEQPIQASSSRTPGLPPSGQVSDMVQRLQAQAAAAKESLNKAKIAAMQNARAAELDHAKRNARSSSPLVKKRKTESSMGTGLYGKLSTESKNIDQERKCVAERQAESRMVRLPALPPADASKVIFLDIDGVMRPMGGGAFDSMMLGGEVVLKPDTADFIPSAILAVRYIIQHTGAILVLTSEWRRNDVMRDAVNQILREYEMPSLASWTRTDLPRSAHKLGTDLLSDDVEPETSFCLQRALEITHWLQRNRGVKQWVLLDPFTMSLADEYNTRDGVQRMSNRLVQTQYKVGFTMKGAKAAMQVLNGEKLPRQEDS